MSKVIPIEEFRKPATESKAIRVQCLTCSRWLDQQDIVFGFCPYCLEERAKNAIEKFRPLTQQEAERQIFPRCAECSQEIVVMGMKTWDTLANSFKLVCFRCGYSQLQKDRQYRETPFGYSNKL